MLKQQDMCRVVVVMITCQDNTNKTADTWLICQTVVSSFWSWPLSMTIQRNLTTLLLMLKLPYVQLSRFVARGHFRWLYKKYVDTCVDVQAAKQLPRYYGRGHFR